MGKLSPRSSVTLHWDCKQLACLGKNLDNWLGVQDTVGDCQQGRQGGPSAAAQEEDSSLLEVVDRLLVAVVGNPQAGASGNLQAVEEESSSLQDPGRLAQVALADELLLCSCNGGLTLEKESPCSSLG